MSYCEFKDCEGEATHSGGNYEICAKCYGAKRNVREIKGETMSNENESGKEIYKEYVNKYFFECKNCSERGELHERYLFVESDGLKMTFNELNRESAEVGRSDFVILLNSDFNNITRAPKTQWINGHEVVAPRYDDDFTEAFWVLNGYNEKGVGCLISSSYNREKLKGIAINGWFDNEDDAIAYANAHRESK